MHNRVYVGIIAAALGLAGASGASAQMEMSGGHSRKLAFAEFPAKITLDVTSPGFKNGGEIPFKYTQYRGNTFPGVSWSKGPPGTRSYVVIMQGAVAGGDDVSHGVSIHFDLFNLSPDMSALPVGLTTPPLGSTYGATLHGPNHAYVGPHTHNFVEHTYHMQVFALDTLVPEAAKGAFPAVEAAMAGHVLASGQVIGQAAMDPNSPEAAELKKKEEQTKSSS